MDTVLAKAKNEDIDSELFPHIAKESVLDDEMCRRLIQEFPPIRVVTGGVDPRLHSNKRFDYLTREILENKVISPLWRETIRAHVSQEFLNKALELFGKTIRITYPLFEQEIGPLENLRAGISGIDSFQNADVLLGAYISVNTPVIIAPTSVKKAHVDNPNKLFVGLFYLRSPEDDSVGGELVLYKPRTSKLKFHGPRLLEDKFVEPVKIVPYRENTLVYFLNSIDAIHGVTPRQITAHPRLFINLVAEVKKDLFDLSKYRYNKAEKLVRYIKGQMP